MFDLPTTFEDFDKLGLEPFADRLSKFIETDRHFVEGALILSLNGKLGCGKSTFFEMWRQKLMSEQPNRFSPILLNAWDADFLQDALLSIVSGFVKHCEKNDPKVDTDGLKESAGKVGKMLLSVGNDIAAKATGVDIQKAGRAGEKYGEGITGRVAFQVFEDRKKAFIDLKELLKKSVEESKSLIVVMVDELDRCRPDYAVEYLEVIKHIFDVPNLVFVLGVDKSSLASSVRAMFGVSLDFDEYYRKFAHRNIAFPEVQPRVHLKFSCSLAEQYFSIEKKQRYSYQNLNRGNESWISLWLQTLKPTPRQLHEALRLQSHVLMCEEENAGRLLEGLEMATSFLCLLSVCNEELFQKIGNQVLTIEELVIFLTLTRGNRQMWSYSMYWPLLVFTGCFIPFQQVVENFELRVVEAELIQDSGAKDWSNEEWFRHSQGMASRFENLLGLGDYDKPIFVSIHKMISEIGKFAQS